MEELWRDSNVFYNLLCFLITENEKLFDRNDARLYWRTVFHLFGILHHNYIGLFAVSLQLHDHTNPDIRCLYTYRFAYLTGWNFTFQMVFLSLSLVYDVLEWIDHNQSKVGQLIKYWRDIIFCGMVLPFTVFVTSMFWTVYAIDRELVFPKIYDDVIPWWFNQCVHTNITVMIIIETLLQARRRSTNPTIEQILFWTVGFGYAIIYYAVYFTTDRWLYKVFGVMNWWQICLYQIYIWLSSYIVYKIQFPINRLIHGSEEENNEAMFKEDTSNGIAENGEINTRFESNNDEKPFATRSWSIKLRNNQNIEGTKL